jgi:hypothetical protein
MPSSASVAGRRQFKHELEATSLETELATELQQLRAKLDRDREDLRAHAREQARTSPKGVRAPVHVPTDESHQAARVAAVQALQAKHDVRRRALRDRQRRELDEARSTLGKPGNHEVRTAPLPHQPTAELWRNLDDARRNAIRGVLRQYAQLHNDADAQHLDVTRKAQRYMGSQATQDGAQSRAERAHYDIAKREHDALAGLEAQFRREDEVERHRLMDQAAEVRELAAKHASENRAGR